MILATGHKGFIGSYLDYDIGLDIKEGNDILDCELPDADVIIHLAAISDVVESVKNPEETTRTNVLGTVRLAERYKDKRFIFASTGGAIQDEIISPYGLSKYCAEKFIKMICKDWVILRFSNVFGKGGHSAAERFIKEDPITIYGNGSQTRSWIYIEDLVRGIKDSLNWPKGLYKFGGYNCTIKEMAEATGKEVIYEKWRKGELKVSNVKNTAPNWENKINIIDYLKQNG